MADKLLEVVTHPLVNSYTAWRGVRSVEATFGLAVDWLHEIVGLTAKLDRFLAVSMDREVAIGEFAKPELKGGEALMQVALSPGVRIAWIPRVGRADLAYQQELLVRPGMMQRIVGIERSGPMPSVLMEVTLK